MKAVVPKGQLTGMRGVFLVAAQLARLGFIVSPTSRSAAGADLLVTNQDCSKAFSVQVKANAKSVNNWVVGKRAKTLVAPKYVYVLVNKCDSDDPAYFVVPSRVISNRMHRTHRPQSIWYGIYRDKILEYDDRWSLFGKP